MEGTRGVEGDGTEAPRLGEAPGEEEVELEAEETLLMGDSQSVALSDRGAWSREGAVLSTFPQDPAVRGRPGMGGSSSNISISSQEQQRHVWRAGGTAGAGRHGGSVAAPPATSPGGPGNNRGGVGAAAGRRYAGVLGAAVVWN